MPGRPGAQAMRHRGFPHARSGGGRGSLCAVPALAQDPFAQTGAVRDSPARADGGPRKPRRIRTLADLASGRARFLNRQPGSGRRLMFDHLLAAAGIPASRINGYQSEEFTHAAVAATIASGKADAGFGIEAAAWQQGLEFVPLAMERYYLAARAAT